ncbi:MAG: hypothetical protein QNJ58_15030 [Desulfobacterales bacterium]|nr:hypothetical protein [Desulfobacterales bacterium]
MKFSKFIMILLTVVLFVPNVSAQDVTSVESKSTQSRDDYPLEDDIAAHPLKAPDTSSPRATLKSFLESLNRAYRILMVAHKKNMKAPGLLNT